MSSSSPEKTYRLASSAIPQSRNRTIGIDRWNQAADVEVIFTFRASMSGAERNDATPVALLCIPHPQ